MDGCVGVGYAVDETPQLAFFVGGEERGLLQQSSVAVFHVLELRCVDVRGVELAAHLGEFLGVLFRVFGVVGGGSRVGGLAYDALEQDAVASVVGHHIFARFGRWDARCVDLLGKAHFVEGLLYLAREIEFEHDGRVGLVVVALAVESAAAEDEVVQ